MASVGYWSASWVSTEGNDMFPGDVHEWFLAPVLPTEVYSVTAQPVTGNPNDPHRTLLVDNFRVVGEPDGAHTLLINVRNVGPSPMPGYWIGWGIITG